MLWRGGVDKQSRCRDFSPSHLPGRGELAGLDQKNRRLFDIRLRLRLRFAPEFFGVCLYFAQSPRVISMSSPDDSLALENSGEPTDRLLVSRLRQGDEAAATELYRRYAARLHGLADRQMSAGIRRTVEPDDIVQSAFRSLFRGVSAGSYQAPEGNSLWSLLAIIAIHKVRRKASRDRSVAAKSFQGPDGEPSSSQQLAATTSEQQFESSLSEAIECLQPQERDIVELRVQGFTVEEISQRVGRSCRTIERTLQRIREKLSDRLLEECDDSEETP
jgi:RNA polymerase sigma-70 factor (ECF subfamily)